MNERSLKKLIEFLPSEFTKLNEPLSKHTTLKIGGPAEVYYEAQSKEDCIAAIKKAKELSIPTTIIGWGSNVLIADRGLRGLVMRIMSKQISIADGSTKETNVEEGIEQKIMSNPDIRLEQPGAIDKKYVGSFNEIYYDESDKPKVSVTMDAGVGLMDAINWTIKNGITGLQWFARIPGNIGGVIYNNVHGGSQFIGDYVDSVTVLDETHAIQTFPKDMLEFGYDTSRFHHTNEIILSATFNLFRGDTQKANEVVQEWGKRKIVQPWNSAGCTFANITQEDAKRAYHTLLPADQKAHGKSTSVGWLVEHVLKMSGTKVGDIAISPKHHNFIVNEGKGTAADFLKLMKEIITEAEEVGVHLRPEIFLLGFTQNELEGIPLPHQKD